jgi:potassium-dependent mechanosensitive channel
MVFGVRLVGLSKKSLFLIFLVAASVIAVAISGILRLTVDKKIDRIVKIGVPAPMGGADAVIGDAIREGVDLYLKQLNRAGGLAGIRVEAVNLPDDGGAASGRAAAEKAVSEGVVGVVGHWSGEAAAAAAEVYSKAMIPAMTPAPYSPSPADSAVHKPEPWLFHLTFDRSFETRFLANYMRNVLGDKIISVIRQEGAEEAALTQVFDDVLQRFGTKVLNRWSFDAKAPDANERLAEIAREMRENRIGGAVFLLADPEPAARALAALRKAGLRNRVAGLRGLATNAFLSAYRAAWDGPGTAAGGLNGAFVSTPLLYDTAGEQAQGFRSEYVKAHRATPDWVSAAAYDGARLLLREMVRQSGAKAAELSLEELRARTRRSLATSGKIFAGLFGGLGFDANGAAQPAAYMGTYDGMSLISALTQLSPIREENVGNYLDELVAGRALYVNDRFMYKTNVVYAGVNIDKITGFDPATGTADLSLNLWFRWRGEFAPNDIVFTNAVQPIKLDKPERQTQVGDMIYHAYRVSGKFYINYSNVERAYGSHIVGVSFRHRTMARNNLMYVSDVLGMNLATASNLDDAVAGSLAAGASADGGWVTELINALGTGGGGEVDALAQMMLRIRALAGAPGWTVGRAWISQDAVERISEGDPMFVGFGKPQPVFSQLDMGALLKSDTIDLRDYVPSSAFLYIAVAALVGSVLAALLDRKDRGQFWRMQTLGLRLVCWPLLLLSAGNLALDYALTSLSSGAIDSVVMAYSLLWWLVPARLAGISMERFIWVPLEIRAQRKVPNVVRMVVALIIYLFAIFGVIAYVFAKPVTSLLATSGLLAMIIGLAVQANIANIFSGIVLNIERPFKVGDYIKVNAGLMGEVIDITWRTVRIRHLEGQLVCLANGKISEAEIHNFSDMGNNFVRIQLMVDPQQDPRTVSSLVNDVLGGFDCFANLASNYFGPDCQFKGVECLNGIWASRYRVKFYLVKGHDDNKIVHEVLARIRESFDKAGIAWAPQQTAVSCHNEHDAESPTTALTALVGATA